MSSSSRAVQAVPVTDLGLTHDEIQQVQQGMQAVGAAGSNSSRAASRASSQGVLMLDASSLAALGRHFDRLMAHIQAQMESLSQQCHVVTMQMYDEAGALIENADAQITRYQQIMAQLDELELDFDRIANIKEIIRGFRQRVEGIDRELERSSAGGSSRRERDRDGHRHGHSHSHRSGHRRHH